MVEIESRATSRARTSLGSSEDLPAYHYVERGLLTHRRTRGLQDRSLLMDKTRQ